MKKLLAIFWILSLTLQAQINIKPEIRYQKVEGWGTSLIWWAHMTGQWEDEAKIDSLVDLLVSPEHLNMNIFRYNIGGGDHPSHYSTPEKPGHMAKGKGIRAEMEGFLDAENAAYVWERDAGQRKIMLKIKEKRPDAIFEAFSNSPPYWMTYSACSAGHFDPSQDNLKPEYYEAFCDYLVEVCLHYKNQYGIEFKTLEPFNEPQTSYWNYQGSQEGCHFDIETQIAIIKILYPKLKASGLNTVIAASDETSVSSFNKAMRAYLKAGITDKLGQINVHTYKVNDSERLQAKRLSDQIGVDFWQSESGPQGIKGKNFLNNLGLAQRLIDDMKIMQTQAWLDWQYMEEHNNTWCLIRGDFEQEHFQVIKNFYVRQQFTKFIKPNYTIIEADDENTLAAISPNKEEIVIVSLNLSNEVESLSYKLPKAYHKAQSYRTTESENGLPTQDFKLKKGKLSYQLLPHSIQTFVLKQAPE